MTGFTRNETAAQRQALSSAEAALSRIQKSAEAAQEAQITPTEAVEQILDELARPSLGRLRAALGRSYLPAQPH
jgi:hypothetical protein